MAHSLDSSLMVPVPDYEKQLCSRDVLCGYCMQLCVFRFITLLPHVEYMYSLEDSNADFLVNSELTLELLCLLLSRKMKQTDCFDVA